MLHRLPRLLRRTCTTSANLPSLARFPRGNTGLYDVAREVDSCGVGMVASLKGEASHNIVRDANTMLVRMAHRGGCGCDPASGDGAGILTGMPDAFLRKVVMAELGKELPPRGHYAAGVVFFPKDQSSIAACKAAVEREIQEQGLGLIGWRKLPVENSELGPTSRESEPHSEMLLVAPREGSAASDFPRDLYKLRIKSAAALRPDPNNEDFYVSSLNTSTIVYKGQVRAGGRQDSPNPASASNACVGQGQSLSMASYNDRSLCLHRLNGECECMMCTADPGTSVGLLQGFARSGLCIASRSGALSLFDKHIPFVGACAALSRTLPQRRDQHTSWKQEHDALP